MNANLQSNEEDLKYFKTTVLKIIYLIKNFQNIFNRDKFKKFVLEIL